MTAKCNVTKRNPDEEMGCALLQRSGLDRTLPSFLDSVLCFGIILHGLYLSASDNISIIPLPQLIGTPVAEAGFSFIYGIAGLYCYFASLALAPYKAYYALALIGAGTAGLRFKEKQARAKGEIFGKRRHSHTHRHWASTHYRLHSISSGYNFLLFHSNVCTMSESSSLCSPHSDPSFWFSSCKMLQSPYQTHHLSIVTMSMCRSSYIFFLHEWSFYKSIIWQGTYDRSRRNVSMWSLFSIINVNGTWSNHWTTLYARLVLLTAPWIMDLSLKLIGDQIPIPRDNKFCHFFSYNVVENDAYFMSVCPFCNSIKLSFYPYLRIYYW